MIKEGVSTKLAIGKRSKFCQMQSFAMSTSRTIEFKRGQKVSSSHISDGKPATVSTVPKGRGGGDQIK